LEEAYTPHPDPAERARRLVIRSGMGHGNSGPTMRKKTGFRAKAPGAWTQPADDWAKYPRGLASISARLRGVRVENTEAIPLMLRHDGPDTLFYVDPPYLLESRRAGDYYRHEMTAERHAELLAALRKLRGMVVLSGYPSGLYDSVLAGWARHEKAARADGGGERVECVWLNPACTSRLSAQGTTTWADASRGSPRRAPAPAGAGAPKR
jgi:DNA adenine methylase